MDRKRKDDEDTVDHVFLDVNWEKYRELLSSAANQL